MTREDTIFEKRRKIVQKYKNADTHKFNKRLKKRLKNENKFRSRLL